MRSLKTTIQLAGLVLVCSIFVACGSKPVIGVLLAESGEIGAYGQIMKNGMTLAIDQAKADGSYPEGLRIAWADSGTDPDQAIEGFKQLVSKDGGGARHRRRDLRRGKGPAPGNRTGQRSCPVSFGVVAKPDQGQQTLLPHLPVR